MGNDSRPRLRKRKGSGILDVVISLSILGLTGTALITLLGQTAQSVRHVRDTERQARRASDQLGMFVAYTRPQLVAMVGRSRVREWTVQVSQSTADLFDVVIADTVTGAPVLATTLYRPDTTRAEAP
jgi:hypothetical protein